MSKYAAMLEEALAEQSSRGAALRGGIPATKPETEQETAQQRFKRLGRGLGVPMNEWVQFYAADLEVIEQDAELTDQRLLAFMRDYADRVRVQRKPAHDKVIPSPATAPVQDYKRHYPAALAALQAAFAEHRERLVSSGYPAAQARVSVGDWAKVCRKRSVPVGVVNEMTTTGAVATLHGFVLPSASEV